MTDVTAECEAAVTALMVEASAGAPSLAGLLRPGAVCLVWDRSGRHLLWATPEARALAGALADEDGAVAPDAPWAARLQELAGSGLPRDGVRLERVRLGSPLAPPTTFACRLISLQGRDAVLTIVVGSLPAIRRPRARLRLVEASSPALEPPADPVPAKTPPADRLDPGLPRRFIWSSDAEGRFTAVSAPLAAFVGGRHAAILGRRWSELAGSVADPDGVVAAGFAGTSVWRNATALWRSADGRHWLPVTLAAAPQHDRNGAFLGFRGFGLCRPEDARPVAPDDVAEAEPPATSPVNGEASGLAAETAAAPLILDEPPADEVPPTSSPAILPAQAENEPPLLSPSEPPAAQQDEPPAGAPAAEPVTTEPSAPVENGRKPAQPVHPMFQVPMFQVLLDASLSGLSHLIASLPAPKTAPAANPPDPAPQDAAEDALAYGTLNTEIGAQLGAAPEVPLALLPADEAPSAADDADASLEADDVAEAPAPLRPVLSFAERGAFHEIARALGARVSEPEDDAASAAARPSAEIVQLQPPRLPDREATGLLDRLPIGVLVLRGTALLFANRAALDLSGYLSVTAAAAQPLLSRVPEGSAPGPATLMRRLGEPLRVEVQASAIEWAEGTASLVLVTPQPEGDLSRRLRALELDLAAGERHLREARDTLGLAAEGVATIDPNGRILSLNEPAERLFGYAEREVTGDGLAVLLAPESHRAAQDAIGRANTGAVAAEAHPLIGRHRDGTALPLSLTFGRIGGPHAPAIAVIMRDTAQLRQIETALGRATRASHRAESQAVDFLIRISHDVRTPLNAIIGFAEMMIEERFGPVGTERYKSYLADIRESGMAVIALVNDLLDLSRAMAGRAELPDVGLDLNAVISASVTSLQPTALRERIILRTSFAAGLPPLLVDERSIRQVAINVLCNAIQFTQPGGQVIASTAITDQGEIALRVRDTGAGMSADEVEAALDPFRDVPATRTEGGRGLGLPLAKALVQANRGVFTITSTPGEGTLVEVLFPKPAAAGSTGRREAV
jgi:PAS domain S-box-containing protein